MTWARPTPLSPIASFALKGAALPARHRVNSDGLVPATELRERHRAGGSLRLTAHSCGRQRKAHSFILQTEISASECRRHCTSGKATWSPLPWAASCPQRESSHRFLLWAGGEGCRGGWAKKRRRRSHERGRRRRGHGTLVAVLPGLPAGRATPGRPPPAESMTEGGSPGFHGSRLSSVGFSFRHEQSVNHPAAVGVTRAAFSWRDSEGAPQPRGQGGRGRGPTWVHQGAGAPVPGTRSLPAPTPRLSPFALRPPSPPARAHVPSRADRHGPEAVLHDRAHPSLAACPQEDQVCPARVIPNTANTAGARGQESDSQRGGCVDG